MRRSSHVLLAFVLALASLEASPAFAQKYYMPVKPIKSTAEAEAAFSKGEELRMKRSPECMKYYDKALKLDPKFIEPLFAEAVVYRDRGQFKEAIKCLDRGIAIDKRLFQLYENRAYCYTQLHNWAMAERDFTTLIKAIPDNQRALRDRAQVYRHMGRPDLASRDQAALNKSKERQRAREEDESAPSVDEISQYIKHFPQDRRLYLQRALTHKKQEEFRSAILDFNKVLSMVQQKGGSSLNYNLDQIYYDRAYCHNKVGDTKLAIQDYSSILKMDPDAEEAFLYRGNCYAKLGMWNEAVSDYTKSIANDKEPTATVYLARAVAYEKLGKKDLAKQDNLKAKQFSSPATAQ